MLGYVPGENNTHLLESLENQCFFGGMILCNVVKFPWPGLHLEKFQSRMKRTG